MTGDESFETKRIEEETGRQWLNHIQCHWLREETNESVYKRFLVADSLSMRCIILT